MKQAESHGFEPPLVAHRVWTTEAPSNTVDKSITRQDTLANPSNHGQNDEILHVTHLCGECGFRIDHFQRSSLSVAHISSKKIR